MNKLCVVLIFNLACIGSYAQSIDDAKRHYNEGQYDSALSTINKLDTNSFQVLRLLADISFDTYNYKKALHYYRKAIDYAEMSNEVDLATLSTTYLYYGQTFDKLSLYNQSIRASRRALQYAIQIGDEQAQADAMYDISASYLRQDQIDSAISYIYQVYEIDVRTGDSSVIASDFNQLGYLYIKGGSFHKGLEYYQKALEYTKKEDTLKLALRIGNVGFSKMKVGRYHESEMDLLQAITLYKSQGADLKVAQQYANLGILFKMKGQLEEASRLQKEAVVYFEKVNHAKFYVRASNELIKTLIRLQQWDEAYDLASTLIPRATELTSLEELVTVYQLKSEIELKKGLESRANESLKTFITLKDSLEQMTRLSQIHNLELRFVTEQKEKEIEV